MAAVGRSMALWLLLAGLLSAAEWLDPADQVGPVRPSRGELLRDVCWVAVYLGSAPFLGWVLATEVSWTSRHAAGELVLGDRPFVVQLAIGVLLADLVAYGLHRAAHHMPVLWRLHRVHHSSTTLRWWSSFRFHPIENGISHVIPVAVVCFAGVPPSVSAVYLAVVFVVTLLAHADVFVPRSMLDHVVVLPTFHRLHHQPETMAGNFALVLPLWDLLFRTAHARTATPIRSDTVLTTALDAAATSQRI
jgi:sterol desaturase/sphingolipid hydroxylase (fatty acid hydroxylase superfamily)